MPSNAHPSTAPDGTPQLTRHWNPDGEPTATVVIVHGLGEHSGRYEAVGDQLAAAGFAVRSFDLIGFGASGGRRAHIDDWSTFHDQLQAVIEEADAEPVHLLGHSMGGLIALGYCLSERPLPSRLVLSAPGLAGETWLQRTLAKLMSPILGTVTVPNGLKGEQLSRDPSVGEAYFADPLVITSSTLALGREMFGAMADARDHLDRLSVPTLVLHGGGDTIVPPPATVRFESVAAATRRLYPTLRHELFNEPEGPDVVDDVITWLQS